MNSNPKNNKRKQAATSEEMVASWYEEKALAINTAHDSVVESLRKGLDHALQAGELLLEVKTHIAHGEFETWVETNCHCKLRTCQLYMRIAVHKERIKSATVADLTIREAMALIAKVKVPVTTPPTPSLQVVPMELIGQRDTPVERKVELIIQKKAEPEPVRQYERPSNQICHQIVHIAAP